MDRKKELLKYLGDSANKELIEPLVDEVVFLEEQLSELKKLPFVRISPKNSELQKATPASRLYVSLMAQYNANVRTLASISGKNETEEESPLRIWGKRQCS